MKKVDINKLAPHPDNPRTITEDKLEKLKSSLEEFQDMTEVRPLVVNKQGQVLGGNMRLRAMIELGWKKAPVIEVDWKEDKQREFMIKDNAGFGDWDYDALANEWEAEQLNEWGLDVWQMPDEDDPLSELEDEDRKYIAKVKPPTYLPSKDEPPTIDEMVDRTKTEFLIDKIEKSSAPDDVKEFMKLAAQRHLVFNYENIAEYYAHAEPEIQGLMEDSALVVVDIRKAIENGFLRLNDRLINIYNEQQKEDS